MNKHKKINNKIIPLPIRPVTAGDKDYTPSTTEKLKSNNGNLYISTLNALTLRTDESLIELNTALQTIKWDILGLSEVRRLGEKIYESPEYIFYYKGETPG